ncbi:MAG: hypothetical protein NVS2B14_00500 [Chamaesiphon sp.]
MTEIDRLPVAQLPSRYEVSRTVIYERMAALQLTPEKKGNKAFVDAEQIKLLDDLHKALKQGLSTLDFLESRGLLTGLSTSQKYTESFQLEPSALQSTGQSSLQSTEPSGLQLALQSTLEAIAARLQPQEPDPCAFLRTLEEAYQNGWLLSTSQVAKLLGLKPSSVNHHKSFSRHGFTFIKQGKNGSESAWAVSK